MLKSKQSVKGCVMRKKEKVIILFLIIFLIVIFVFLIIAKNNRSKMIENNNHREDVVPEKKENDTNKSLESNEIEKKDLKEKVENKKTDKKSYFSICFFSKIFTFFARFSLRFSPVPIPWGFKSQNSQKNPFCIPKSVYSFTR